MNSRTLLALFDSRKKAAAALRDLKARAFPETEMDLLSREPGGDADVHPALPATEQALAGLVSALIGCGMKQEQAENIEQAVRSGKTLVTLDTERVEEAACAIKQHGGEIRTNTAAVPPYKPVPMQPLFFNAGPGSNLPEETDVPAAAEDSRALFPPQPPQLLDADPALLFAAQAFAPEEPDHGSDSACAQPTDCGEDARLHGDLHETAISPIAAETVEAAAEAKKVECEERKKREGCHDKG